MLRTRVLLLGVMAPFACGSSGDDGTSTASGSGETTGTSSSSSSATGGTGSSSGGTTSATSSAESSSGAEGSSSEGGTTEATGTSTGMQDSGSETGAACQGVMGSEDPACDACLDMLCCEAAQAYVADPNPVTYSDVVTCAQGCPNGECYFPVCNVEFGDPPMPAGIWVDVAIAQCVMRMCCEEMQACAAEQACTDCVFYGFQTGCNSSDLDEPLFECLDTCM